MAHTDSTEWNETYPTDAEYVELGAREIRLLRAAVRTRLLKEHVEPAGSNVGGEHKAGSAVSYIGDYSEAFPTQRPDGATNFTADDLGRLAYNTNDGLYYILTNHSPVTWTLTRPSIAGDIPDSNDSIGEFTILGVEVKFGKKTFAAMEQKTITFTTEGLSAFTNYCSQVFCCYSTSTNEYAASANTPTKTTFILKNGSNEGRVLRWFAIGK